jgi:hypothetical protein
MFVVQLDAEHRAGQHSLDATFDLNVFFFHETDGNHRILTNKKAESGSPEPRPEIPTN